MNELLERVDKEIERLTRENKVLKEERRGLGELLDQSNRISKDLWSEVRSFQVKAIYHHKKRKNTTIVFADDTSITVHLKKGDRDCLETAIAWALMKHNYNIKGLLDIVQEVGE